MESLELNTASCTSAGVSCTEGTEGFFSTGSETVTAKRLAARAWTSGAGGRGEGGGGGGGGWNATHPSDVEV